MSASSTHIYLLSILTTMKRIEQSGESTMTHNGQLMPSHICRNFNNNFISSWKPPRAKSYHIRQSAIHWHHHFTNLTFLWAHKQPNKTQRLASATYRHHLYRLYCVVCIYYMKWSTSWRSSWALYTICIYNTSHLANQLASHAPAKIKPRYTIISKTHHSLASQFSTPVRPRLIASIMRWSKYTSNRG